VRQRYEKLQTNDLPAVISEHQNEMENDAAPDNDDDSDADIQSMSQISVQPSTNELNSSILRL
jgi:hypothetical protein